MTASAEPPPTIGLDEARQRLRELGYLDGRVERFVFRRALAGRPGVFLPAIAIGALSTALAGVAAVASAEPGFVRSPGAIAALAAHLSAANLLPAAFLAWLAARAADRSRAPAGAAMVWSVGAAILVFVLWIAGSFSLGRNLSTAALLWGVPLSAAALALARNVRAGFLARAYAHSRVLPGRRRHKFFLIVAGSGALAVAALYALLPTAPPAPPLQPSPRFERVVVLAIDGLDLAPQDPLLQLFATGASAWWPARTGGRSSPPEVWTDLATGVSAERHGVRALERVRPAGSPLALRPPRGTAWYLHSVGPALALVTSAPVSDRDRHALAFWEVAASAGLPSQAVGWWASGQWPGARVVDNREILARAKEGFETDPTALAELQREGGQGISTVYLPGLDILRRDPIRRAAALDQVWSLLRYEIARAAAGETVLVLLSVDSHPRDGQTNLGRMVVYDSEGASGGRELANAAASVRIGPEDVAPSILARAGIPMARDLPGQPVEALFREGSLETATVETYGPRRPPRSSISRTSDREYLEKLKSLGYLN